MKKAGLWLCNHFCKDTWNKLYSSSMYFCIKELLLNSLWTIANIVMDVYIEI